MSDRPTRRLTGLYKLPDIEDPDEETINAVAEAIYRQMVERSELRAPSEPDKRRRPSSIVDEDQDADD